ncbi:MAG: hypothetical protein N2690_04680 [Rhodocyclaceae bacterium]|nr:hypothetical protein [Rhodocyclaceae bacterium]
MEMPWPDARDFAEAAAGIERERLLANAIAARAAQADENGWKAFVKEMTD